MRQMRGEGNSTRSDGNWYLTFAVYLGNRIDADAARRRLSPAFHTQSVVRTGVCS